jgi:hypothetical protein
MTIAERIRRWSEDVARRVDRPAEVVEAVYDEDLSRILMRLALLEPLERGELRCYVTGEPLSWDNLGGLVGTADGPRLISEAAIERVAEVATR